MSRIKKENDNRTSFCICLMAVIGIVAIILLLLPDYAYSLDVSTVRGIDFAFLSLLFFLMISAVFGVAELFATILKIPILGSRYSRRIGFSAQSLTIVALGEIFLMTFIFVLLYRMIDRVDLLLLSNFQIIPDTIAIDIYNFSRGAQLKVLGLSFGQCCLLLYISTPCYLFFAGILNYVIFWKKRNPYKDTTLRAAIFSAVLSLIMPALLISLTVPMILLQPYPKGRDLTDMFRSALILSHTKVVSALINKGADINYRGKEGYTTLMLPFLAKNYTSWRQDEIIKMLIEKGVDVNSRDDQGNTALMHACKLRWPRYQYRTVGKKCVDLLLDHGTNINDKNNKGMTALMIVMDHNLDMAKQLIRNGADVNAKDNEGRTALMTDFLNWPDTRKMELLLRHGADVNAKDNNGRNALMMQKSPKLADMLIEYGVDINARDNNGNTALMIAAANTKLHPTGRIKMVKFLVFKGADVNAKNNLGKTALMLAVTDSKVCPVEPFEIIEFLLCNGADKNFRDRAGNTALELAKGQRFLRSVKLLESISVDEK